MKTSKGSKDPKFEDKKRIGRLTRKRLTPPGVLGMDEIGPLRLTCNLFIVGLAN